MIEVQILIPVRGNDGTEFTRNHHQVFEEAVSETIGGWQRRSDSVSGAWKDKGTGITYHDDLYAYVILVDGIIANAEKIISVVNQAKSNYQQLAMYVSYHGIGEIL